MSDDVIDYATRLIEGVQENSATIDEQISGCSQRWSLERMPVVDKSILRMAVFELLWVTEVPTAVVINEAVELAKLLSTAESGKFINGILGKLAGGSQDSVTLPDL